MRRRVFWARVLLAVVVFAACESPHRVVVPENAAVAKGENVDSEIAVRARLAAAVVAKGPDYKPRTRHLTADGGAQYTNRLVLESSPYLLQHAHNPVDWYPWGDEAFERARQLGRPIFLSIGYSTCHWCHVMEEESFEDEAIASFINQHYVAIKVDREERPDVDAVYMTFLQAFSGSGGWPMNVWVTADREPFFAGTYFAPRAGFHGARTGLIETLTEQGNRFATERATVVSEATEFAKKVKVATVPAPAGDFPPATLLLKAADEAARRFEPEMGGMRGSPKFPSSFPVRLLSHVWSRADGTQGQATRAMATLTLRRMHQGGLFDQLAGGFHRYSTDARWQVPHFEKMLYDNALLVPAYLEIAQPGGDPDALGAMRDTLDFMLRDLRAPDGTFYASLDADSLDAHGKMEEGAFYTWTNEELTLALGDGADARIAAVWFGVGASGRSVLSARKTIDAAANELKIAPAVLARRLPEIRARLLAVRSLRPPPLRDEKVIVAWNGLAISALARVARARSDQAYADAAVKAALVMTSVEPLPHVLVKGVPQGRAFADDIALLAAALLDVFELNSDSRWLSKAIELMEQLEQGFADPINGGYFSSDGTHEKLLLRAKPDGDGPIPSANSVAAMTWLRLAAFTEDDRFRQRAETTMRSASRSMAAHPMAHEQMLLALDWVSGAPKEVVVVVPDGGGAMSPSARPLMAMMGQMFLPNVSLVVGTEAELAAMAKQVPWVEHKKMLGGHATAYVCQAGTCRTPQTAPMAVFAYLAVQPPLVR